jgi:hypothetical protein
MSLPTELARAFGKRASVADNVTANGTTVPRSDCEWRGIDLPRGCLVPPEYPAPPGVATGVPEGNLGSDLATYWMTRNTLHVDGGQTVVG